MNNSDKLVLAYDLVGELNSNVPLMVSEVCDSYKVFEKDVIASCDSFGSIVVDWNGDRESGTRFIWVIDNFIPASISPICNNLPRDTFSSSFECTKIFDGYSACFRQWRATHSHCKFLHGYSLYFKVWFEGELDEKNWVYDFGAFKRNGIKDQLTYWFDHTTVVAMDDPELDWFIEGHKRGVLDLRIVPNVGAERYAELVFNLINNQVIPETLGRVRVKQVECFEHDKNSAIYKGIVEPTLEVQI